MYNTIQPLAFTTKSIKMKANRRNVEEIKFRVPDLINTMQ